MKNYIVLLLIFSFQIYFAQVNKSLVGKVISYKHGHNGMELVITSQKETIIISTFNSKLELKEDIAQKIYTYYKNNKENKNLSKGYIVSVDGIDAKVTGKCLVTKKGKLIAVEFYYQKIEWNSGITEFYNRNLG